MKHYLFPKFFRHRTTEQLMEDCAEAGIDGPTALVRAGYWLEEDNLSHTLPAYIRAAQTRGLEVRFADTSYSMAALEEDDTPLRILADNGITALRLGYVGQNTVSPRELSAHTRRLVEKMAATSARCGLRALLHLHGGCYPHSATAAYPLVQDLDPAAIGVLLDPGNNVQQEGYENFAYQAALLSEYLGGLGLKDCTPLRLPDAEQDHSKGWRREWAPAFAGQINWHEALGQLRQHDCDGPIIYQPFYSSGEFAQLFVQWKREIRYTKQIEHELLP